MRNTAAGNAERIVEPRVIKTEKDRQAAFRQIESLALLDPKPGTPAGERLELLATLVEQYEKAHFPIDAPDPIAAIRFRMEQQGLSQADLVPFLGSRSRASEILSGKRPLTLAMIRALRDGLGIPADVLVGRKGHEPERERRRVARRPRPGPSTRI